MSSSSKALVFTPSSNTAHQVSSNNLACNTNQDTTRLEVEQSNDVVINNASEVIPSRFPLADSIFQNYVNDLKQNGKLNIPDKNGYIPLISAVNVGNKKLAKMLIEAGANINIQESNTGQTPLHIAIYKNNIDLASVLIHAGANVNFFNKAGLTPLHTAIKKNNLDLINLLIKSGANVNIQENNNYDTPLHIAVYQNNMTLVKRLIEAGANPSIKNKKRITPFIMLLKNSFKSSNIPLISAVNNHDTKLLLDLIEQGVDLNIQDNEGFTALHISIYKGNHGDAINLIKAEQDIDLNTKSYAGLTPLDIAINQGGKKISATLIKAGAHTNLTHLEIIRTFLKSEKDQERINTLKDLIKLIEERISTSIYQENSNSTLNKTLDDDNDDNFQEKENKSKVKSLHFATKYSNKELVELLIKAGADINEKNDEGLTPLHIAILNGNKELAEFLIKNGAKVNTLDNNNNSPLYSATIQNNTKLVKLLLENNANSKTSNNFDYTPLLCSIKNNNPKIVQLLLDAGADMCDPKNIHYGSNLLHYACNHQNKNFAEFSLSKKTFNVNSKNDKGRTPLFYAVCNNDIDLIKLLIDNGADLEIKDNEGLTPLEFAKILLKKTISNLETKSTSIELVNKYNETIEFLEKYYNKSTLQDSSSDEILQLEKITSPEQENLDILENTKNSSPAAQHSSSAELSLDEKVLSLFVNKLKKSNELNTPNKKGIYPLFAAIEDQDLTLVQMLLKAEANPNIKDSNNNTPLRIALENNNLELIQLLIDADADCNIIKDSDYNFLDRSIEHMNMKTINLLVSAYLKKDKVSQINLTGLISFITIKKNKENNKEIKNSLNEILKLLEKIKSVKNTNSRTQSSNQKTLNDDNEFKVLNEAINNYKKNNT